MLYNLTGMNTLATYIHNLDPVLLEIPGTPLALRWYGLAYVGGFILGYLVLKMLSARKLYCLNEKQEYNQRHFLFQKFHFLCDPW